MGAATRVRSVRRQAVLVGVGLGAVALSAVPAHAVIGVGNPAFSNVCAKAGGPRAAGATVSSTGTLAGNAGQLPVGLPRNHCGNSGLTCSLGAVGVVDYTSNLNVAPIVVNSLPEGGQLLTGYVPL